MSPTKLAARLRDDRGMGLMEVVVAVILLGVLSTIVVSLVLQAQAKTVSNRARIAASNLAAREIDLVREQFMATDDGPARVADAGLVVNGNSLTAPGEPSQVDGTAYTVRRTAQWNVVGSGASACEGGSLVQYPTLTVSVEVTWPNMGQVKPVTSATQLAPPRGFEASGTQSYVAVKVTDASGRPNVGRSVWVGTSALSGTRAVTDASGCAVATVSPSAAGTTYVVSLDEAGYVDISGAQRVVRNVGLLRRGTLSSSVDVAYDRAVTLDLRLSGGGATDADVAGQTVTVYRGGGFAGSTPETQHPVTGLRTVVRGLWPGDYAAYVGASTPASLDMHSVAPGATAVIDVSLEVATIRVTGAPTGGTLLAVPDGETSCTSSRARELSAGGEVTVLPGTWRLLARSDDLGCSPGPSGIAVGPGATEVVVWTYPELEVRNAPSGYGTIWAVSSAGASATCTPPSRPGAAVRVGSAPSATVSLPAGDWYVFVSAGPDSPSASGPCASAGLVNVAEGGVTVVRWPAQVPGPGGRS